MARGRHPGPVLTFVKGGKTMEPPDNMPEFAVELWRKITAQLPKDHFRESDLPLLRSYCWSAWQADEAQKVLMRDGIEAAAWSFTLHRNAINDMTRLATKLRLCPSSESGPNRPVFGRCRCPRMIAA